MVPAAVVQVRGGGGYTARANSIGAKPNFFCRDGTLDIIACSLTRALIYYDINIGTRSLRYTELDPEGDGVGEGEVECGRVWDADVVVGAVEVVGGVGVAESVLGKGGTVHGAVVPVAAGIAGVTAEGVAGNQSLGGKALGSKAKEGNGEQGKNERVACNHGQHLVRLR